MLRKVVPVGFTLSLILSLLSAVGAASPRGSLSAAEIVNKNVVARGGLQAWRAVQSIVLQGELGVGGNQRAILPTPLPSKRDSKLPTDLRPTEEILLPFVLDMQRHMKVRFELQFKGETSVQVFDGTNGWKLRPYLNRREIEPYTAQELTEASMQAELDGPLVDYRAKGSTVELNGIEKVEDHDAYKLKLTMKSGQAIHVWIDTQSFLEAKIEGQPRRLDGVDHPVEIYYRNYRSISGLQVPFVLETKVLPIAKSSKIREASIPVEKILIQKVVINPKLDASLFIKPQTQTAEIVRR